MGITSMSRAAAAGLLIASLGLTGCLGRFQEPEITLEGVRVGSVGFQGGLLYAQFRVWNPNGYGLETRALTYDLEITSDTTARSGWVRLAEGSFDGPIAVGARDSTRVEVPVEFRFGNLAGLAVALLDRGAVDYRIRGSVDVRQPISRVVPFRRTGKVSFDAIR